MLVKIYICVYSLNHNSCWPVLAYFCNLNPEQDHPCQIARLVLITKPYIYVYPV